MYFNPHKTLNTFIIINVIRTSGFILLFLIIVHLFGFLINHHNLCLHIIEALYRSI